MKLTVTINLDGDAFREAGGAEVAYILRLVARHVEPREHEDFANPALEKSFADSNGNTCAHLTVGEQNDYLDPQEKD